MKSTHLKFTYFQQSYVSITSVLEYLHCPQEKPHHALVSPSTLPITVCLGHLLQSQASSNPLYIYVILLILEVDKNELIQYVFYDWFILLSTMFSEFICVIECISTSLVPNISLCRYSTFAYPFISWKFSLFLLLAIMNDFPIKICVHFMWTNVFFSICTKECECCIIQYL